MNHPLVPALRDIEILFRPFAHRKLKLKGRIVMAPSGGQTESAGSIPTAVEQYYRLRAEHDIALIITEPLAIDDPAAAIAANSPAFTGGTALRRWKSICRAVHAYDCKIAPQLYHAGMARDTESFSSPAAVPPVGPSGIHPVTLQPITEPMNRQRMDEIKSSFGRAAAYAKLLGFDAVEIQGSGGFLIDQFLWKETNQRTDEYGGSIAGRVRFACEVVHAVRKAVGRNFPIIFRIAQWKPGHQDARLVNTAHELEELLHPLSEAGVDIFHCSATHYARPALEGNPLTLAAWVRLLTGKPTICIGGIEHNAPHLARTLDELIRLIRANTFDLLALEQALHHDPAWVSKLRHGE